MGDSSQVRRRGIRDRHVNRDREANQVVRSRGRWVLGSARKEPAGVRPAPHTLAMPIAFWQGATSPGCQLPPVHFLKRLVPHKLLHLSGSLSALATFDPCQVADAVARGAGSRPGLRPPHATRGQNRRTRCLTRGRGRSLLSGNRPSHTGASHSETGAAVIALVARATARQAPVRLITSSAPQDGCCSCLSERSAVPTNFWHRRARVRDTKGWRYLPNWVNGSCC